MYRQRDGLANDLCPGFLADEFTGVIHGTIFVVAGQDIVTLLKRQRAGDDVHSVDGIGDECQVFGDVFRVALSACRATCSKDVISLFKNITGCCSSRPYQDWYTSNTGCGHTPKESWLRKMTFGSSRKNDLMLLVMIIFASHLRVKG